MKRGLFILIAFAALTFSAGAQQLPLYSQYLFNKYLLNPSVAGNDGFTSYNLTAREQWLGYSGAPRTYSFSFQTRLMKRSYIMRITNAKRSFFRPSSQGKVGLGGLIFSDKNGLVQRTGVQATYAYHTRLNGETQLSFGMSATAFHFRINEDQISFEDPDDPVLFSDLRKGVFIPDANFGVSILNYRYNIAFSVEQLFQSYAKIGNPGYDNLTFMRHYYLFGSYTQPIGVDSDLQPNFMFRMSEQWKPQVDIGLNYLYKQDLWAGLSYRTGNVMVANIGARFEQFYFGYAFDFSFTEIQRVTYGSHELMIAMKLGDSARRYRWLDRY